MRCVRCGNKVKTDDTFCTRCGSQLDFNEQGDEEGVEGPTALFKAHKKPIIIGLVIICFIGYFFGFRCKSGLCMLPSGLAGEYCVLHTCKMDGCTNKIATDKSYCYTHSPSSSVSSGYRPESAKEVLNFSNIEISHNSSYTICTGTITNNGKSTYTFLC